ncbi:MAG: aminopeptidase P family protein [Actinobacteria bacterium]|nr:aminopeptidase P family protein [Actinomycetota bacterium]
MEPDPRLPEPFHIGAIPAPGVMAVDWEERVDFQRMRDYRLARVRRALEGSDLGALLLFDTNNVRYVTAAHIGEWGRDKLARYTLVTRTGDPIHWDFGSAAKNHRLHSPWFPADSWRSGMTGLRGSVPPDAGLFRLAADEIQSILAERGAAGTPIGIDVVEVPMVLELQSRGVDVRDGQQVMLDAREVKNRDEIVLLATAASMVDAAYQLIFEDMKPGVRESDLVARVNELLYTLGSEHVEGINAVGGERGNPHPHDFSDRLFRPGDTVYFDILHAYNGYRTCYYRTLNVGRATQAQRDAYRQCREWLDAAIEMVKPGVTTDQIARLWPTAEQLGFPSEMEAFALQFGHGLGMALHERPIISRLVSLDAPMEIKEGMVFALETWAPARDGHSAARIEEEVVVTRDGAQVITKFPAEDLLIANEY